MNFISQSFPISHILSCIIFFSLIFCLSKLLVCICCWIFQTFYNRIDLFIVSIFLLPLIMSFLNFYSLYLVFSVCVVLFLVNQAGNYVFQYLSFLLIKEFNVMNFPQITALNASHMLCSISAFSVILFIKVHSLYLHPRFIKELVNRQLFCFPYGRPLFLFLLLLIIYNFISFLLEIFLYSILWKLQMLSL